MENPNPIYMNLMLCTHIKLLICICFPVVDEKVIIEYVLLYNLLQIFWFLFFSFEILMIGNDSKNSVSRQASLCRI